jgi:hypothetical protein
MMRRQPAGDLFPGPGVPPSFVELPERDDRSKGAAVDVLLVIRIVDLVDERDRRRAQSAASSHAPAATAVRHRTS